MKPKRPSHPTIVAYLALFVALGGTAWAALHVGSKDVVNNSLRSSDLRNRKAVGGKDVVPNSLGGRQIDESTLNPTRFLTLSGSQPQGECPLSPTDVSCASTEIKFERSSRILAIASGAEYGTGSPNSAACEIHLDNDGAIFGSQTNPGEENLNSSPFATNGFGLTGVSRGVVDPGTHRVSLVCASANVGTALHHATIAALAIAGRKH